MCFSATASFVAAAVTGTIGVFSIARATDRRDLLLAATPLVFAAQQAIEGMLWTTLTTAPNGEGSGGLIFLFLLIADVLWPIFVPLAVILGEPDARRRQLILACLLAGIGAGGWMLSLLLTQPARAFIQHEHIAYEMGFDGSVLVSVAYLAATALSLLLSSRRAVVAFGVIAGCGSFITWLFYWEAYVSVWCFFAAAASVVLLCHFEWVRMHRLRTASA